jgi:CheY-specific phosphatase CheX
MISNHARNGFDHLLKRAIQSTMVASPNDVFEIAVIADPTEIKQTKIVILTVSSYLFRLMVLIHFTPDSSTKELFSRINHVEASEMSEQSLYDAIAECGNMFCGVLNRDLCQFFPHLGMSTPNFIDKNCSSYLNTLNPGHIQHLKVNINDTPLFHVSMCVSNYSDLDFVVNVNETVTHTGELELF